MRVTIEHVEAKEPVTPSLTTMLLSAVIPFLNDKVYRVKVDIQFSEEEIAIIKHRNLSGTKIEFPENRIFTIRTPEIAKSHNNRSVGSMLENKGFAASFLSIPEAQEFEQHVRERILPTLKALIVNSADYGSPKTFEL